MNNTPNTPLSHTATNLSSFSRSNLFPSKSDFPSQAQFFPTLLLSQCNINILSYFFFHMMNRYQTLIKKRITFSRHKALFSTHPPPTSNLISANDEPLGFVPAEVIKKKRDGKVLTESEIHWMISEFHNKSGTILDYQMASNLKYKWTHSQKWFPRCLKPRNLHGYVRTHAQRGELGVE